MDENRTAIFSILKRDPRQSGVLLKFGLGGALAIVVLDWAANLFLSSVVVLPIELLLIIVYASGLTFLIARLVHAADRFEVESALQARRLLTGSSSRHLESVPAGEHVAPAPAASGAFHQFYFLLRITEEVQSARRDGRQMSVIALDVTLPGVELTPAIIEKISLEIAHVAANQAKTITQCLNVGPTEFVFSLANADQKAAKSFVSKVVQALGEYWCYFGVAVYPKDATNAETLIECARRECEGSRQDRGGAHAGERLAAERVS